MKREYVATLLLHAVQISEEIVKAYNLPIERIKWIYKDVLGSPREFEFRRQELGLILGHAISDEEVIKSLLRSILPHGIFYEYLANAQLGVCPTASFPSLGHHRQQPVCSRRHSDEEWNEYLLGTGALYSLPLHSIV